MRSFWFWCELISLQSSLAFICKRSAFVFHKRRSIWKRWMRVDSTQAQLSGLYCCPSSGECWWNAAIAVTRWPLREEGRRQVDIWPVCYCEFQICWLSGSIFNLRFQRRFTRRVVVAHLSPDLWEKPTRRKEAPYAFQGPGRVSF